MKIKVPNCVKKLLTVLNWELTSGIWVAGSATDYRATPGQHYIFSVSTKYTDNNGLLLIRNYVISIRKLALPYTAADLIIWVDASNPESNFTLLHEIPIDYYHFVAHLRAGVLNYN